MLKWWYLRYIGLNHINKSHFTHFLENLNLEVWLTLCCYWKMLVLENLEDREAAILGHISHVSRRMHGSQFVSIKFLLSTWEINDYNIYFQKDMQLHAHDQLFIGEKTEKWYTKEVVAWRTWLPWVVWI